MYVTDHLQRTVFLPKPPERIISLVPSQTELLVDLGLGDRLVGLTKFCVHPAHLRKSKAIVGGTKTYRYELIDSLSPDLIIGNKEENDQVGIARLAEKYPVWLSDIASLADAYRMIRDLGQLCQVESAAEAFVQQISSAFAAPIPKKGSCVYLIWNQPMMAAGKGTFIDALLTEAGFDNRVVDIRYPVLQEAELQRLAPDFLLLSSEPFPFKEQHICHFQSLLPKSRILKVNGELFSWYGSRLLQSAPYFRQFE
jgi:ABC-type Fe3+-hydroxamate transport system substrate-binding protein